MKRSEALPLPASLGDAYEGETYTAADLPAAVERMVRTDGWQAALALHTAHWDRLVSNHPEALLASLEVLPGKAYIEVPSLLVATNYLRHLISDADPGHFHDFAHDERGSNASTRGPLDQLIASAGRTAGLRTSGRLNEALSHALDGRRTLETMTGGERASLETMLPHLLTQWGRSLEVNDAGGEYEFEQAWETGILTKQPQIARRAAASLAWLHADHGELNQADLWIERARSIAVTSQYDAPLHLAAALTAIDRLDRPAMLVHLNALQSVPIGEYWAAAIWVRAWAADSEPDAILVEKNMTASLKAQPPLLATQGSFQRYLTAARVRIAATCRRPLPQAPAEPPITLDRVIAASAAYLRGDMHAVLREAAPAAEDSWLRMRVVGLLLTAAARHTLGRPDGAATAFTAAHTLIEAEQFLSTFVVIGPDHLTALADLTNTRVPDQAQLHAATRSPDSSGAALATLTPRERQILKLLTSGRPLRAIADELFISPNTVKGATKRLYRKLGVNSREQAADFAHRAQLD